MVIVEMPRALLGYLPTPPDWNGKMAVAIVSLVVGVGNIELPIFATVGVALCETIATLFRTGPGAVVLVRATLLTANSQRLYPQCSQRAV
jgi:hypothetical protein